MPASQARTKHDASAQTKLERERAGRPSQTSDRRTINIPGSSSRSGSGRPPLHIVASTRKMAAREGTNGEPSRGTSVIDAGMNCLQARKCSGFSRHDTEKPRHVHTAVDSAALLHRSKQLASIGTRSIAIAHHRTRPHGGPAFALFAGPTQRSEHPGSPIQNPSRRCPEGIFLNCRGAILHRQAPASRLTRESRFVPA